MNEENHDSAEVSDHKDNNEFDPSKMLEMAKLFSTLMADDKDEDQDEEKNQLKDNDENEGKNQNNIFQMLEMAKLFSGLMGNTNDQNQSVHPAPPRIPAPVISPATSILFDESIHTPQMKVVKAAIPYMEPSQQKILGIFIKSLELKKVIDSYKNNENPLSSTDLSTTPHWKVDMLNSIRPHCTEEKQCIVDMMARIMDIGELMKRMNYLKSNNSPKTQAPSNKSNQKQALLQTLSPMLNENQKQMLTMLTTLMDHA